MGRKKGKDMTQVSPEIQAQPSGAVAAAPPTHLRVREPFTLVIFGATGALTSSKLLPALFRLWQGDYFATPFAIVGVGRRDKNDTQFRNELREAAVARAEGQPPAIDSWEQCGIEARNRSRTTKPGPGDRPMPIESWPIVGLRGVYRLGDGLQPAAGGFPPQRHRQHVPLHSLRTVI